MARLIDSGTLTPGISATDFHLPPGTALRCERPAETLRWSVGGYFVMDSVSDDRRTGSEWMLPSYAQIWVTLTAGPINVGVRRRRYAKVPKAFLLGPSSQAMPIKSNGGATVGIEITPIGWSRLVAASAEDVRDQLVPLETMIPPDRVTMLALALATSDRGAGVKAALDTFFTDAMALPHRDEAAIVTVMRIIADDTMASVAEACGAHGIDPRLAARVARRYFGFPLKLLIMRSRFLHALMPMLEHGMTDGVPAGYYDRSHFLRSAKQFLGMTPRQYPDQKSVYVSAVARARRHVLGVPVAAMEPAPG
jgi:AraC-like DNA-binding protein